jgi:signal transduction histidine kinase
MRSILIVDDQEGVRSSLVVAFESQGYRTVGVDSAEAALDLLDREVFDVVLSDLIMPGLGGFALMERVCAQHPATAVILMTGASSVESAVRAMKGGACDYVTKPFTLSQIFHVVGRSLEQQRLRQENAQLNELNRRLQEVDQLKSNLLSAISHEFRTPLTIMQGWLDLLLGEQCGPVPPAQRESLQALRGSADRLDRLIANLLAFADCEWGEGIRERLAVDVGRMAQGIIAELGQNAARRQVSLALAPDAPADAVTADPTYLRLALYNLIANAIKFNAPGSAVTIALSKAADGWEVAVTNDRGEIPPDEIARLGTPFTQGEMGSARPAGGLGLGLAVARAVARAHGGRLELASGQGRDTTVRFRVPAAPAAVDAQ